MADRDIHVIEPADSQDLITLAEVKLFLNINPADTSRDTQLALQISTASAVVADLCNRKPELGFGECRLIEEWREVGNGRLFLMHWPIKLPPGLLVHGYQEKRRVLVKAGTDAPATAEPLTVTDYTFAVTVNGTPLLPTDYRIDFNSGKISVDGQWVQPAVVTYTGGYKLPVEAPLPLKKACALIVQEDRIKNQQASVAGMRQISHKESRVAFYDPNALLLKSIGAKSPGMQAAEALIRPYIRIEV